MYIRENKFHRSKTINVFIGIIVITSVTPIDYFELSYNQQYLLF